MAGSLFKIVFDGEDGSDFGGLYVSVCCVAWPGEGGAAFYGAVALLGVVQQLCCVPCHLDGQVPGRHLFHDR